MALAGRARSTRTVHGVWLTRGLRVEGVTEASLTSDVPVCMLVMERVGWA